MSFFIDFVITTEGRILDPEFTMHGLCFGAVHVTKKNLKNNKNKYIYTHTFCPTKNIFNCETL